MKSRKKISSSAIEKFGNFKGLDLPFVSPHSQAFHFLSPIYGMNRLLIKNLRSYGHNGQKDAADEAKNFTRPTGFRATDDNYPKDNTASLLERLFPSTVGLVFNARARDPVTKCLTPAAIGELLALANTDDLNDKAESIIYYTEVGVGKDKKKVGKYINNDVLKILNILLSAEEFKKAKVSMDLITVKKQQNIIKPDQITTIDNALKLAELLCDVMRDNKIRHDNNDGYPEHVFEKILLTFMWEKYKNDKTALKPFYAALVKAQIISQDDVDKIPWEGEASIYSYEDYQALPQMYEPNNSGPALTKREHVALSMYGNEFYNDTFPPAIEYGNTVIKKLDGQHEIFSDCGDTLLRNIFMIFLYDPVTKRFDVSRLDKINELFKDQNCQVNAKLKKYFTKYCTSLSDCDTEKARKKWVKVSCYINLPDEEHKVKYLKPNRENGYYGIDKGIDNIAMAFMKLLGMPPCFTKDMKSKLDVIKNYDALCVLFAKVTPYKAHWRFTLDQYGKGPVKNFIDNIHDFYESKLKERLEEKGYDRSEELSEFQDICDFNEPLPKDGWYDCMLGLYHESDIVFKKEKYAYQMHFDELHFDCNKVTHFNTNMQSLGLETALCSQWFGKKETTDDITRIYEMRMDTIEDRITALDKIYQYSNTTGTQHFRYLLSKWLEPSGIYFGGWLNSKIVNDVLLVLTRWLTSEEILALNIPKITETLNQGNQQTKDNNPQTYQYTPNLFSSNMKLTEDQPTHSALHLAVMKLSRREVECLLRRGVNVNEVNHEGNTALQLAVNELKLYVDSYYQGKPISSLKNYLCNKKLAIAADVIKWLIINGADISKVKVGEQNLIEWLAKYEHIYAVSQLSKLIAYKPVALPSYAYIDIPEMRYEDHRMSDIPETTANELNRVIDAALKINNMDAAKRCAIKLAYHHGVEGILRYYDILLKNLMERKAKGESILEDARSALSYLFLAKRIFESDPEWFLANISTPLKKSLQQPDFWEEKIEFHLSECHIKPYRYWSALEGDTMYYARLQGMQDHLSYIYYQTQRQQKHDSKTHVSRTESEHPQFDHFSFEFSQMPAEVLSKMKEFINFIITDNTKELLTLLDDKLPNDFVREALTIRDHQGKSAFDYAIDSNQRSTLDILYKIIEKSYQKPVIFINPMNNNAYSHDESTMLHYAIACRQSAEVIKGLLASGQRKDAIRLDRHTPLSLAAKMGYLEGLRTLLEAGADIDALKGRPLALPPLWEAVRCQHIDCIQYLLARGANPNLVFGANEVHILEVAMSQGCLDIIDCLVQAGAEPPYGSIEDIKLYALAVHDFSYTVDLLKRSPNEIDKNADTLCSIAMCISELDIVTKLLDADIEINVNTAAFQELFHQAAAAGLTDIMNQLIRRNFDLQEANESIPLLMIAIFNNQYDVVQLLLDHGLSPAQSRQMSRDEIENIFVDRGVLAPVMNRLRAFLNDTDAEMIEVSAMDMAYINGSTDIIKLMERQVQFRPK